jgi:hypothetical protein
MTAPANPTAFDCAGTDEVQESPGVSYVVPAGIASPVITSWSTQAASGDGQQFALKVFEKIGEPATFRQISHDGPHALTGGTLNTFAANVPVRAGEFLGVGTPTGSSPTACIFGSAIGNRAHDSFLNDGESASDWLAESGLVNASAVIEPSHNFTIGSIVRNRKKGTARVKVSVPGPGRLALSGKGVRAQTASRRDSAAAKSVAAAGTVALLVRAKGRQSRRLEHAGKVKLKVSITYTPTGGSPGSTTLKLNLRKS